MNIVKPWIKIEKFDGAQLVKNCELAARTCYRTEGLAAQESRDRFLRSCLARGHESIIEHEKVTIRMLCDLGTYKDLTRHRLASFSIESTRYCAYDKDKFGNELTFIEPIYWDDYETIEARGGKGNPVLIQYDIYRKRNIWYSCMKNIEDNYMKMREIEATPDECRMLLPHSIAAEVVMTANLREWRHILQLRTTKFVHPHVQQMMIPVLLYFQEKMPALFDDIKYNEDFAKEKYAIIEEM